MVYNVKVSYYARNPLAAGQREHWSLFVIKSGAATGTIFEASGGTLQMKYNEKPDVTLTKSSTYKGSIDIGDIADDQLNTFAAVVRAVQLPSSPLRLPPGIRRRDCQDWVRDAVDALVESKLLDGDATSLLNSI
jgi:hypothetical protein